MQWLGLVVSAITCLAFLLIPGLLLGWLLGLRRLALIATAPLLSITVIAGSAVVAGKMSIGWSIWPQLLVLAALAVPCGILGWLARRWQPVSVQAGDDPPTENGPRPWLVTVLSLLLSSAIATWQLARILPSVDSFSETFDNILHMNLVRWILDNQNGSSWGATSMTTGGQLPGFYPAAWHDLVSTTMLTLGTTDIAVTTNATIWAVMAVVWPLGCLFLARQLFPQGSLVIRLGAGILASSFAAFPSLLIGFGVLYPNFLAFSLLPALVAWAATILKLAPAITSTGISVIAVLACLPGLFLAHPNGVLSYIAILLPLGVAWCLRGVRASWRIQRRSALLYILATFIAVAVFVVIWHIGRTEPNWNPPNSSETSLAEALLASPLLIRPFWLLGLLICIGLINLVTHSRLRWWIGPTAVILILWGAASAMSPGRLRDTLVAGYYDDPFRLAALLPITLFPLALAGLESITSAIDRYIERSVQPNRDHFRPVVVVISLLILLAGVQFTPAMNQHIKWVRSTYTTDDSFLVDSDELTLIKQLPDLIPPGTRVATNPWTGSSMAYALEDIPTTTTHIGYISTADLDIINRFLNKAATESEYVCPALRNLDVGYVLDFGKIEVNGGQGAYNSYQGFEDLSTAPGFAPVMKQGDAVLYRIDACSGY